MLKLVKADLIALIKHHRTIFVVIVLSLACSFTILGIMTGVVSFVIKGFESGGRNYIFTLDLKSQPISDQGVYEQIKASGRVRNIVMIQAQSEEPMFVGWYGGDNLKQWFVLDEGRFFSEEEIDSDVAIVSANFYPGIAFEEGKHIVRIVGESIPIIGVGILPSSNLLCLGTGVEIYKRYYPQNSLTYYDHEGSHLHIEDDVRQLTAIVPAESFLRYGLVANILRVEYYLANDEELNKVSNNLKRLFPYADIVEPVLPKQFWRNRMSNETLKAITIIGCGFINMIALFTYWLFTYRRTHSLYRVMGADKRFIICIILLEWFALMVLGALVGNGLLMAMQPLLDALYIYVPVTVGKAIPPFVLLYLFSSLLMGHQIIDNCSIDLEVL